MQPKKSKTILNILKALGDQKTIFYMFYMFSYHSSYYCPKRSHKRVLLWKMGFGFSVHTWHGSVMAKVHPQVGRTPDCRAGSTGGTGRPDSQAYEVQDIC